MTQQAPDSGGLPLTPEQTVQLGEHLAQIPTLPQQQRYLEKFFQDHLKAEIFLWLNTPLKSATTKIFTEIPGFDPDSSQINQQIEQGGYVSLEADKFYWIILPMVSAGNAIGKVILKREFPFETETIASLQSLSKVISMAIHASSQEALQQWRKKQLSLVKTVTEKISQITNLENLTQQITRLVKETFNYSYVAVFLINEDTGRLHFKASSLEDPFTNPGIQRPEFEQPTHPGFEVGEHMIGYVVKSGKELIANDVQQEPRYKQVDSLAETKSEAVIPLRIEDHISGVFDVQSDQKNAFDENDLLVLRSLADNIAIAIQSTRLYESAQKRVEQLAAVSEVSRSITMTLDIDELLQQIVDLIRKRFEFPFVHLYIVDPVEHKIKFTAGSGERMQYYLQNSVAYSLEAEKGVLPWVARTGLTKRINNVQDEPLFIQPDIMKNPVGSEMAIPLSFGGQILGVLDIQSETINAFSLDDQKLMETLADNIAIAIRNGYLYRSEKWRRQVAESLRDVAGLLSDNIALSDILDRILKELQKNLPCDIAGIWFFDPETADKPIEDRRLYLAACHTSEAYQIEDLDALSFSTDSWVQHALDQTMPKIRQPDESQGPIAKYFNLPQNYSSIAAPLYTGEEVLGMLTLDHHTPGRYGDESQKITSAFASYAAIAIKNSRLYSQSQEQAWISTILLQVATATQSITNLDELASTIVRLTPLIVGVKGCALFLRELDSNIYSLYALYGIGEPLENPNINLPIIMKSTPIWEELFITKKALRLDDLHKALDLPEIFANPVPNDEFSLLPLIARNEILGAFLIAEETNTGASNKSTSRISEERNKIIQGIMQQTAVAVENIRLLEARQEEAYISTVLLQSAQAAVSSAELDDTLDSIVHIMPVLVGIDASLIYLWDPDEERFRVTQVSVKGESKEKELLETVYNPGDFPMLDAVYRNNQPIVFPFVETTLPPEDWDLLIPDERQTDPTPILQSPYPVLMGFPLSMKNEVFGVLLAKDQNFSMNRERRFELLLGMSQQASLAIQNDILNKEMIERQHLEREFQLAREIQQTFLPEQTPDIPGWKMDVYWEPARQVGGDFYDYFLLPDGRLAFVIADVSDKGLAASLYMTVTRTLLRTAALESTSSKATLEKVNELLLVNSQDGFFITTFYGILSLDTGNLVYTIAGHNPPLLIRFAEKKVIEFEKGGIALGALPNIKLDENQMTLHPGDCMVLYTDGVTEAFDLNDQIYGEKRLERVLKTSIGEDSQGVLKAIKTDLDSFRGNAALSDDTTILVICRTNSLTDHHGDLAVP